MAGEVIVAGADALVAKLRKKALQIERDKERAARSAANIFRRYVRAEARAIRGEGVTRVGVTKTGRTSHRTHHMLESRVMTFAPGMRATKEDARPLDSWAVRDKAPHAHLVIRGHEMFSHNKLDLGFRTRANPFVHRAFVAAGHEPLIAARVVLFEGGPEVPDA